MEELIKKTKLEDLLSEQYDRKGLLRELEEKPSTKPQAKKMRLTKKELCKKAK